MLKNAELTDVRVYELNITVLPRIFKATLEFTTPAMIELKQEIPVTNGTPGELIFDVERQDELNGNYFKFPNTISVKGDST